MERDLIHHRPRHFDFTLCRSIEFERDIMVSPHDQPTVTAACPSCGATMLYRGIGRLRSGKLVHCFECVHSHREVHSVSIVIAE